MKTRWSRALATIALATMALSHAPSARADVAGINMGAPVWEGVPAEDALQASIATGAHYVRVNFRLDQWSAPDDATLHGGKTWFSVYDHIVDAITAQGLEVYGLLSDELTTGFSRADYGGAAFEDAYAKNALAVIERYRDRVRVFETINEPNDWAGGTSARIPAAAFARLHARVYDDAKRAHAGDGCWDVSLVTGPLFSFDDNSSADYLDATIAAGRAGGRWKAVRDALGHDPIDGVGYHLYVAQGSGSPASDVAAKGGANLDAVAAVLGKYGISGRPTWVSEIGWKIPDVDEATQAARVDTTYATFGTRADVASLQWFTIQDFPGNDWGLFSLDGFSATDARPSRARFVAQAKTHAPDLAARLKIDVPATVAVGTKVIAHVTATNLGKVAWTRALDVRLGAAAGCPSAWATNGFRWADVDPADGYTKDVLDARRYLRATDDVPQGSDVGFDVTLAIPIAPGKLRVAARMVREGVAWFGATVYADVDVTGAPTPEADAGFDAPHDTAVDGASDAPSSTDAGGTPGADGSASDRDSSGESSGCGCRVAGAASRAERVELALFFLAIAIAARRRPRVALTIAGSDPSGGAGIQGDLRTFTALDVHGLSVVTCLTVQGTRGVRSVSPVSPALVRAQLETVLEDVRADVVKTGALATHGIVQVVIDVMRAKRRLPLVVDPVSASSSGAPLLDRRGVRLLVDALLPRATVVTPNVDELAQLLGIAAPRDVEELAHAGELLRARTGAAILAKGGHLRGAPIDVLIDAEGTRIFRGKRIVTRCTHGTGCTLASAIAARLAWGDELRVAVREAKSFVERALRAARPIGPGKSPLAHLAAATTIRTSARSATRRR